MSNMTSNPAKCKGCAMIRFLHTKKLCVAEIRCQNTEVYGEYARSEIKGQKWCREISDSCTIVHDRDHSSEPPSC